MTASDGVNELKLELTLPAYPRSGGYDSRWMLENLMGPNAVWLTEALAEKLDLRPGMRVLDIGCGRAISSIFLAREFGVRVWATDLWIKPSENWSRIVEAGLEELVCPIYAEAHALPFAHGFFDVMVSMDAYHYFGTDDLYLSYYRQFLKPDGQLGIVVPGLNEEFANGVPDHLQPYWIWEDFCSFHSPAWWSNHWDTTRTVDIELADILTDGWRHWLLWLEVAKKYGYPSSEEEAEMLRIDAGRNLGFTRLIARSKTTQGRLGNT